jgi:TPR repeat protein
MKFFIFYVLLSINCWAELLKSSGILTDAAVAQHKAQASSSISESSYRLYLHYRFIKNVSESLKWLRVAAIQGNPKAQHEMYVQLNWNHPNPISPEYLEAIYWLKTAASSGYDFAKNEMKRLKLD